MLPAANRLKFSLVEKGNENLNAESGFHSQNDISCVNSSDFSHSRRKSYCLPSHRGSYKQNSLSESQQLSSGYGSSFSLTGSLSNASSASALVSPAKNRKRKSEVSGSDENFYNSYQFVSPCKVRKRDPNDKNCAKLILKEKCPSENIILSSTPIRTEQRASKWGKFRSFHPEKLQFGKSIEQISTPPVAKETSSLNFSSFNLSSASFIHDIPEQVQTLWTGDIKNDQKVETVTSKTQDVLPQKTLEHKSPTRQYFNGKVRFDILGSLHSQHDIALEEILKYMDDKSLLSLSHVSKPYRQMITSNKSCETKRKNYLKYHRSILENKYPASVCKQRNVSSHGEKKAFGNSNLNQMSLRQRIVTPPHSPQRRHTSLQQHSNASKKCPRCRKPATIKQIPIRSSPRKLRKRIGGSQRILQLSPKGRISKRLNKPLLSKTSIYADCFNEAQLKNCHTLPLNFDEEKSSSSSSYESPGHSSSGSEDSTDEIYEFAECTATGCCFKFCVKCNCKYHPRFFCGDLSPPSPTRVPKRVAAACTKSSLKSLKRLFNN